MKMVMMRLRPVFLGLQRGMSRTSPRILPHSKVQWRYVSSTTKSAQELFAAMRLSSFSEKELKRAYAENDKQEMLLREGEHRIEYPQFKERILELATRRDPRVWPIATAMALGGISVGAVLPVMPVLVQELGLDSQQYGLVIASFGVAKLLANTSAARFIDSHGRRASMVLGLSCISAGYLCVGAASGFYSLALARVVTGAGVSFLVAGSTMAAADISTQLNRASTTAPLGAAFNAGTICGPALGGLIAARFGASYSFIAVAGLIAIDAIYAQFFIIETKPKLYNQNKKEHPDIKERRKVIDLLKSPQLLRLGLANFAYWNTIAGVNMTILPMTLAQHFDASGMGSLFALQAAVSVTAALPVASLADKIGPQNLIAPAFILAASANSLYPMAHSFETFAGAMITASLGSALLGSAPTAAVANAFPTSERAQALAHLRTAGDLGLLSGSTAFGAIAAFYNYETAFSVASVWLLMNSALFALSSPKNLHRIFGIDPCASASSSSKEQPSTTRPQPQSSSVSAIPPSSSAAQTQPQEEALEEEEIGLHASEPPPPPRSSSTFPPTSSSADAHNKY